MARRRGWIDPTAFRERTDHPVHLKTVNKTVQSECSFEVIGLEDRRAARHLRDRGVIHD
jgi:hypothetical protein